MNARKILEDRLAAKSALLDRIKKNKFRSYYPDEGPLRRELYPKHLEFFAAGLKHRERAAMAGNRVGKCVSADTLIETPNGLPKRVSEIVGGHWVWAWDGVKRVPAWAEQPFKKPAEMVYRVWLQSGQYVDCAAEHRFLGVTGWLFLSDLFECVPCLPVSTEGFGQLESYSDVLSYLQTVPGSTNRCSECCRPCDARLRFSQAIAANDCSSQADVQQRNPPWLPSGDLENKRTNSPSLVSGHPSNWYGVRRAGGQWSQSEYSTVCNDDILCIQQPQGVWQLRAAVGRNPQSSNEVHCNQCQCAALVSPNGGIDFIIGYQPLGVQDIWDFHVPYYLNYCTSGFVHHNTEGLGAYEVTLHLTGLYPDWWVGRRFDYPVNCIAAGDTRTTTRDIQQAKLLGPAEAIGTGMVPHDYIGTTTGQQGVPGAFDIVKVKHEITGGWSTLQFRSYDQGRKAFQGTERDVVWLDEEPPRDVYDECLLRTMTTGGIVLSTFTPLNGLSEVAMMFLPELQAGLSS